MFVSNLFRALRLPFITASIFPFVLGSLAAPGSLHPAFFFLGLIAVITTHLGSNLINDYADSRSGGDWKDTTFYGFFGGSKIIQENIFPERFFFLASILCLAVAGFCVGILSIMSKSLSVMGFYFFILVLAWSYSEKPLRFSYRRMGEIIIFILFGPALVMGGYYLQTGIFPAWKSFLLSLPPGILTMAILFANEVPDFNEDIQTRKYTLVSLCGVKNAYYMYTALIVLFYGSVALNVFFGTLGLFSLSTIIVILLPLNAVMLLRNAYTDKVKLVQSSKMTILFHTITMSIMIADILLLKRACL